jgi:cytochrome d ubiquinol oxidase subunit I
VGGAVELSRLQFAMTAMYHFLFVPLTLGLSIIVAIMETVYVMTNRPIWRQMTKFWATLFGINFVLGVATGITMEFQFGMNWSYYSHYVGDIFGAPLAIEGLMAFFLEATFVGLMFFGWDKLSKRGHHVVVTWLVAIGSNFSALWILIANGWMQNPVGAEFNPMTMRMEMTSFFDVLFNEVAQAKFVHTVSAGYVTASVFVLGVSAWYLLKGRHIELARRSIAVAASFGLASALSVVVLGDESGYSATHSQQMKLAAIEAMWETEEAPAPFTAFGFPDQEARETHYAVHIPWAMGLIGTRSLDTEIPGINELEQRAEERIARASSPMTRCRRSAPRARPPTPPSRDLRGAFRRSRLRLPAAALHRRSAAGDGRADHAGRRGHDPDRLAAVLGLPPDGRARLRLHRDDGLLLLSRVVPGMRFPRWALWGAVAVIPTPWIAAELGWFVAEFGRQPWTVDGVLPTAMSVSHLGATELLITLAGFVTFYSVLFIVEMGLMVKYIRKGPFLDVEETDAWMARHEHRLRTHDGNVPVPSQPPRSNGHDPLRSHFLRRAARHLVGLLGVLLIGFALTDGFDMGVGALLPFVGKTDTERRMVINTVGPVWEGNQVWFILGGGAIFAAWPPLYAVSFSGFYLAMFVVLAAFIVRPVAFKYRSKRVSPAWRSAWDWALLRGVRGARADLRRGGRQRAAGRALSPDRHALPDV